MGRIISVYGPDGSGKTTLSYALADRLASQKNLVLIVHTDFSKPVLTERVPQIQNCISLGQLLMTEDYVNIEKTFISYPENRNVFVSGIVGNENYASYPPFTPENAKKYIEAVAETFDYVLVDSTDSIDDTLAIAGLSMADFVIELLAPNIQGVIFQQSYDQIFSNLNAKGKTTYAAAKIHQYHNIDAIEKMIGVSFSVKLPYSSEVDLKAMSGGIVRGCSKREGVRYEQEIKQLQRLVS